MKDPLCAPCAASEGQSSRKHLQIMTMTPLTASPSVSSPISGECKAHAVRQANSSRPEGRSGRIIVSVLLAVTLSACASMSEEECLTADWKEQGYRDGRSGFPLSRVEEHREACAKVGVVPNVTLYTAGRNVGIREYCTPENGLNQGLAGYSYRNACPMELERDFLIQYKRGYRVYEAQQRVNTLKRDVENKERQLDKEKDDKKRRALRRELRDLDDRLMRARRDLFDEERRLRRSH